MGSIIGALRFLIATVISMGFAVLAIVTLPVNRGGKAFHALARAWARVMLFICGVRVRVEGIERLDRSTRYVYVSNHASMFDIPAIIAGIPDQIRIVYKRELERIPFFGWGLKWGSYIGIDRNRSADAMKSLQAAAEKIRRGASVLLYAEGTRTTDGKLQPFKRGAFNIAVKAGVPVVPLTVNGSYRILQKHSIIIRPGTINLILGNPIAIDGKTGKDAELELMQQVHTVIEEHYIDQ